jgi:hypothetical protein
MDLQFFGNVPAVGNDCIHGDEQFIGYVLILQPLHNTYYHITPTV